MNSALSVSAYAISWAIGFLALRIVFRGTRISKVLLAFLAPGAGLAITSLILFVQLFFFNKMLFWPPFIVHSLVLLVLLIWVYFLSREKPISKIRPFYYSKTTHSVESNLSKEEIALHQKQLISLALIRRWQYVLCVPVCIGALLMLTNILKSPFGTGIDAWAIWRIKARFIFHDPFVWENLFRGPLSFSPVDYPLFYPLGIVWGWLAPGRETHVSSLIIAYAFTLSIVGILSYALLSHRRDTAKVRKIGRVSLFLKNDILAGQNVKAYGIVSVLAGLLLISTPQFIGMGSSQYADIIVAYFNLAAVVMIHRGLLSSDSDKEYALSGGFFLGAACFVKNEGILFASSVTIAIAITALAVFFRNKNYFKKILTVLTHLLAGALPMLVVLALFKARVNHTNAVVSLENISRIFAADHLADRFVFVTGYMIKEMLRENGWIYCWVFIFMAFCLNFRKFFTKQAAWLSLSLIILNLGFFAVYLIPVSDPTWKSWDRMLLQQFPVVVYFVFTVIMGVIHESGRLGSRLLARGRRTIPPEVDAL